LIPLVEWSNLVMQFRRSALRFYFVNCFTDGGRLLALVATLVALSAQAQTYKILYQFHGKADGRGPGSSLIEDSEGNLYGITQGGGNLNCNNNNNQGPGCGVVFKLGKSGDITILHRFQGATDGVWPQASLIRDEQGNLYGTTSQGGETTCTVSHEPGKGCGTIFRIDPCGHEVILYRFKNMTDGAFPVSSLYRDAAGNLWGTASSGGFFGSSQCKTVGCGTVFRLNPEGKLTSWPFLGGPNDGANPVAGLTADAKGNLYGTTQNGGIHQGGTLFKITPSTYKRTLLHYFGNFQTGDASFPNGNLIFANGALYGVSYSGGSQAGGAVYEWNAYGEKILASFEQGSSMSYLFLQGALARDPEGNLYGTTEDGEENSFFGELYELDPAGNATVLHYFGGDTTDGGLPLGGVILDSAGHLYGTTSQGGTDNAGTVYELTP
jgi:uncharacterized repeat protein (TIGR03803 family)